jgi:excisionase family DNA binding protein
MNANPEIPQREPARRPRPRAMSIAEFSERYGLGRTTIYKEINLKRLRAHKCGRRTFITEDDAEDWLRSLPLVACNTKQTSCEPVIGPQ